MTTTTNVLKVMNSKRMNTRMSCHSSYRLWSRDFKSYIFLHVICFFFSCYFFLVSWCSLFIFLALDFCTRCARMQLFGLNITFQLFRGILFVFSLIFMSARFLAHRGPDFVYYSHSTLLLFQRKHRFILFLVSAYIKCVPIFPFFPHSSVRSESL